MGFFIIETLFFISLGISVVLVALLAYHFKQRLSSLEQKYETLFDIVAGTVKQLSNIQLATQLNNPNNEHHNEIYQPQWNNQNYLANQNIPFEYTVQQFHMEREPLLQPNRNINIVEELDDNDSDSDSDIVSDSDSETESDMDDSVTSDESVESDDDTIDKQKDHSKLVVSDDDISLASDSSSVKIINLNVNESSLHSNEIDDISQSLIDEQLNDENIYENPVQDIELNDLSEQSKYHIGVKKIIVDEPVENISIVEKSSAKDLYKKMTLNNLKATVISKGLCSDPSKMKKNELLKLLEDE